MLDRKLDTRKKIQLGGLVKKAGLQDEPSSVLLGIFLEAFELLQSKDNQKIKERWRLKGDIEFSKDI